MGHSTEHTVQAGGEPGRRVRVEHSSRAAIQYDFYIPEDIWRHPSVQAFIERLQSFEHSATIFNELSGVWQGAPERTRIYRIIFSANGSAQEGVRDSLREEIGRLMAELSTDASSSQEAFLFTETDIRICTSTLRG